MTTSVARHQPVASGLVVIVLVAIAAAQDRNPAPNFGFTVPPGFKVERVAGPPLVDRPISRTSTKRAGST